MHQQRSKSTLNGLQLRAYLFLISITFITTSLLLLVVYLIILSELLIVYTTILFTIGISSAALSVILSFSWKCPLCIGAVWKKMACRRNKNAIKALGISYRLGVALAVVFRRPYRCPYCGEKFSSVKVRS